MKEKKEKSGKKKDTKESTRGKEGQEGSSKIQEGREYKRERWTNEQVGREEGRKGRKEKMLLG